MVRTTAPATTGTARTVITVTMASDEDHDQYQEEHNRTPTGKRILTFKKKKHMEDTHPRTSNNNKNSTIIKDI